MQKIMSLRRRSEQNELGFAKQNSVMPDLNVDEMSVSQMANFQQDLQVNKLQRAVTLDANDEVNHEATESLVGKHLSDLTTVKVIILVLAMMFSDPVLSYENYFESNSSFLFGLDLLRESYSNQTQEQFAYFSSMFDLYVDQHKSLNTKLINIKAQNLTWVSPET